MELIIGNLQLFDVPEGFADQYDKIQEAKLNVLFHLSHRYGDATPIFFEIYGKWALWRETDRLLSSCFDNFVVRSGQSPVDSSPINNRPKVLVDNRIVELDLPALKLITVDSPDEIDSIEPNTVFSISLPVPNDRYQQIKDKASLTAQVEPPTEEHFLFNQIMIGAQAKDSLSQIILMKLLKGESICG